MDIFNVLTMLGGLSLFLFGMSLMGQALERRAGGKLRTLLDKMTSNVFMGFLTGLGVTAIIQSSSATTVMVVGFVNSGLMTLRQAINVIMGANVGTTVTAWLLQPGGHRRQFRLDPSAQALFLHPGAGPDRHHLLYVLQGRQEEGHGHHPAGLCHPDVRHGDHERRRVRPVQGARLHQPVPAVSKPHPGRTGGDGAHGHHPVQLRLRGYSSGPVRHRRGQLRRRHPHHHGPEHRHHA